MYVFRINLLESVGNQTQRESKGAECTISSPQSVLEWKQLVYEHAVIF